MQQPLMFGTIIYKPTIGTVAEQIVLLFHQICLLEINKSKAVYDFLPCTPLSVTQEGKQMNIKFVLFHYFHAGYKEKGCFVSHHANCP